MDQKTFDALMANYDASGPLSHMIQCYWQTFDALMANYNVSGLVAHMIQRHLRGLSLRTLRKKMYHCNCWH